MTDPDLIPAPQTFDDRPQDVLDELAYLAAVTGFELSVTSLAKKWGFTRRQLVDLANTPEFIERLIANNNANIYLPMNKFFVEGRIRSGASQPMFHEMVARQYLKEQPPSKFQISETRSLSIEGDDAEIRALTDYLKGTLEPVAGDHAGSEDSGGSVESHSDVVEGEWTGPREDDADRGGEGVSDGKGGGGKADIGSDELRPAPEAEVIPRRKV